MPGGKEVEIDARRWRAASAGACRTSPAVAQHAGIGGAAGEVLAARVVQDQRAVLVAKVHHVVRDAQPCADARRLLDVPVLPGAVAGIDDRARRRACPNRSLIVTPMHLVAGVPQEQSAATEESTPPLMPTTTRFLHRADAPLSDRVVLRGWPISRAWRARSARVKEERDRSIRRAASSTPASPRRSSPARIRRGSRRTRRRSPPPRDPRTARARSFPRWPPPRPSRLYPRGRGRGNTPRARPGGR